MRLCLRLYPREFVFFTNPAETRDFQEWKVRPVVYTYVLIQWSIYLQFQISAKLVQREPWIFRSLFQSLQWLQSMVAARLSYKYLYIIRTYKHLISNMNRINSICLLCRSHSSSLFTFKLRVVYIAIKYNFSLKYYSSCARGNLVEPGATAAGGRGSAAQSHSYGRPSIFTI